MGISKNIAFNDPAYRRQAQPLPTDPKDSGLLRSRLASPFSIPIAIGKRRGTWNF